MEAVLLGLTPAVRVADRQSPLAGALRRELAAVTGLAVTPLDLDPRDEGLFDALADALEECQVLVTIGDLEHPGGLRRLLTRGLGLETRIDPDALADAEAWCRAHPEARIAPGELAEVPAIAEVFRTGGVCGFGLRSRQQAILCLPGDPESFLPLLLREGYAFLGSFLGREIYTMELPADGVDPQQLYRQLDGENLPMALEYNLVSTGAGQRLRLIAPERGLLYLGAEAAEHFLPDPEEPQPEPESSPLLPPENPEPSRSGQTAGEEPHRRWLIGGAAAVLLILAAAGGFFLLGRSEEKPSQPESSSVSSEESSEESEEDSSDEELPSYENGMPGDYLPQFEEFYSQNPDVVGYLEIEGTDFSYPVVQYTDNEYYLRRGFDGEENENGTPFVDYRTNLRTTQNTIVYGHNMRTGTMFETLLQYRDMNFYKEHPVLEFDSVFEPGEYKVFGMFVANTRPEDGPIFDYLNFLDGTEETFMDYVENVRERSLITTGVDVQPGDRLITLSTCSYEFTEARFVVVARKVRDGEDPEVDISKAYKTPNPLMPRIWYDLYGGDNPYAEEESGSTSSSSQPESSSSSPSSSSSQPESSSSSPSSSSSQPESSSSSSSNSSSRPPRPSRPSSSEKKEEEGDHEVDGDLADEELAVMYNGRLTRMNAYDLVSEIVESETRGALHPEAIKAQVVATYTYVKYSNQVGIYPAVNLRSSVSREVKKAVDAVFGEACYYNGDYINAVYHSVSCGTTASAKSVWGTNLPYLQPVDSEYDELSPYYEGKYTISEEDFADAVDETYGIDLYNCGLDPEDWILIDYDEMASGDYVGRVEIGGEDKSQGGDVSRGVAITGRNVRESLLDFNLRSTCFEVEYNSRKEQFVFTTRGYGHGVGMSQWGANYLAEHDGYTYKEILKHYYTGIKIR